MPAPVHFQPHPFIVVLAIVEHCTRWWANFGKVSNLFSKNSTKNGVPVDNSKVRYSDYWSWIAANRTVRLITKLKTSQDSLSRSHRSSHVYKPIPFSSKSFVIINLTISSANHYQESVCLFFSLLRYAFTAFGKRQGLGSLSPVQCQGTTESSDEMYRNSDNGTEKRPMSREATQPKTVSTANQSFISFRCNLWRTSTHGRHLPGFHSITGLRRDLVWLLGNGFCLWTNWIG